VDNATSGGAPSVISARSLVKTYVVGDHQVKALRGVNIEVPKGEFLAVTGPSGSGKSTFMHIVGCLDKPTSGHYFLDGQDVSTMSKNELAAVRNKKIGFVFQGFNLLSRTSALDNVELPLLYGGSTLKTSERHRLAKDMLAAVGLGDRFSHHPNQLSGGQQQRVAIARALANDPPVLIADEPTGNLDSKTANAVFQLFASLVANGKTVVMVTHDSDLAKRVDRAVIVADGAIVNEYVAKALSTLTMDQLALVTRQLEARTFTPGAPIICQGEPADQFYIITKGQVEILLNQPAGHAISVATMGAGQYFGEIGLLRGGARTATVRASGEANVEVVALDRAEFSSLIADSEATKVAIDRVAQQRFVENSAAREREVAHA
jgi:ABC-type lipoprotein export system ATPase subunit